MLVFIITLMTAVRVAAQTPATAALAGCISDAAGSRVPGVTIVVKASGVAQRQTTTDTTGCYDRRDLAPASYRVTASLAGFDNITRDRVVLADATATRLDFVMHISAICDCVRIIPPRTLAEAWARADAVLHVRIAEPEPGSPIQSATYRHVATVLHALKRHAGEPAAPTTVIVENQRNGAPAPYDVGQELVVFPSWDSAARVFYGIGPSCCDDPDEMTFVVQDGRIKHAPASFSSSVGAPVDVLLNELRAVSRSR
jgi:carboxypeptidase family protein